MAVQPPQGHERRACIDPREGIGNALEELADLHKRIDTRKKVFSLISYLLLPVTCPIYCCCSPCFPDGPLRESCCFLRPLPPEDKCQLFSYLFTPLSVFTRANCALPPERQRMEELKKPIAPRRFLLAIEPFIEGVHQNKGIVDLTLSYLADP